MFKFSFIVTCILNVGTSIKSKHKIQVLRKFQLNRAKLKILISLLSYEIKKEICNNTIQQLDTEQELP